MCRPVRWVAVLLPMLIATAGCTAAPTSAGVASGPASVASSGVSSTPATGGVATVLASLRVAGRAPLTGYSRAEFGPAWTDDNGAALGHNGCDTRNDVLRRDLRTVVLKPGTHGCAVLRGALTTRTPAA